LNRPKIYKSKNFAVCADRIHKLGVMFGWFSTKVLSNIKDMEVMPNEKIVDFV
jgi:hypothetical protein